MGRGSGPRRFGGGVAIGCLGPIVASLPLLIPLTFAFGGVGASPVVIAIYVVAIVLFLGGMVAAGSVARARFPERAGLAGLLVGLLAWRAASAASGTEGVAFLVSIAAALLVLVGLPSLGWFIWPWLRRRLGHGEGGDRLRA